MNRHKRWWIWCMILLLISACTDQRVIERVGFVQVIAYDAAQEEGEQMEKETLITVSIPQVSPDARATREVLTVKEKSDKDALLSLSRKTNRKIVSGQLRTLVFGIDLAEDGIRQYLINLNRDPEYSSRIKVALVNGLGYELINEEYPEYPNVGRYLSDLLEKEAGLNMIPDVRVYHFKRDLMDDGIDPVAPVVKKGKGEIINDGIGLFQDDRYVTKINPNTARIFSFLRGDFNAGDMSIVIEEEEEEAHIFFSAINNRLKVKVNSSDLEQIVVDYEITVSGSLLEYTGSLDVSEESGLRKLEEKISAFIERATVDMIKTMQEHRVDSTGMGKHVRNSLSYQEWEKLNWREVYPNVTVRCHAKAIIRDFGVMK